MQILSQLIIISSSLYVLSSTTDIRPWFLCDDFIISRCESILIPKNTFSCLIEQSSSDSEPEPETQSIYLEGALPHESRILVSDSQTTPESFEPTENSDEPAVSWNFYILHSNSIIRISFYINKFLIWFIAFNAGYIK